MRMNRLSEPVVDRTFSGHAVPTKKISLSGLTVVRTFSGLAVPTTTTMNLMANEVAEARTFSDLAVPKRTMKNLLTNGLAMVHTFSDHAGKTYQLKITDMTAFLPLQDCIVQTTRLPAYAQWGK
jgi:hypothetical protein